MIAKELLSSLACPVDHVPLRLADATLLDRLNRAIAAGTLKNRAGRFLARPLDAGLGRADDAVFYPILDDIPVLLADEGILLDQIADRTHP